MRDAHDIIKDFEKKTFEQTTDVRFQENQIWKKGEKNSSQPTAKFIHFCFSMKFEQANYFRAKNTSYINDFVKAYIY